jgi:GNAT superfamily N-acetyltransferase
MLRSGGAKLAAPVIDPICALYDEVFAQPPFAWRDDEPALHRARLTALLDDPTFGVVLATDGPQLTGFGYGFTLAPHTTRWTELSPPLPSPQSDEWPGRTFVLFDFAVRASHRGRGLGRAIHDRLLGSRAEERATLTVQPTAVATKAIYEQWGWRPVGTLTGGPTAAAPVFDAYLRDTLADLRGGPAGE